MRVYPERMLRNLDASFGLVFSQPVLLALIESGKSRDDAYRIVQKNAMRAWKEELNFRDLVLNDPEIVGKVERKKVESAFDLNRQLRNVDKIFTRVFGS